MNKAKGKMELDCKDRLLLDGVASLYRKITVEISE